LRDVFTRGELLAFLADHGYALRRDRMFEGRRREPLFDRRRSRTRSTIAGTDPYGPAAREARRRWSADVVHI